MHAPERNQMKLKASRAFQGDSTSVAVDSAETKIKHFRRSAQYITPNAHQNKRDELVDDATFLASIDYLHFLTRKCFLRLFTTLVLWDF